MDPQQRMLLEGAWEALAGGAASLPSPTERSRWGVAVGISGNEYGRMADSVTAFTATGSALSVASGRVSYIFGLQGPSVSVDTACSSSLVGTHLTATALLRGEMEAALSSGVNVTLTSATTTMFSKAGMLAADGRCKTLDSRADGYARGEACGVMRIEALWGGAAVKERGGGAAAAVVVLARLRSSAVNQDGRSSSLTAPNGPSQQRVIRSTLQAGALHAWEMSALQLHGTGTGLGDPIELGAAHAVLLDAGSAAERRAPLAVGAVKSWMAHTEPAAGVVGQLAAVQALTGAAVPAILHLISLNPHLENVLVRSDPAAAGHLLPRAAGPHARAWGRDQALATGVSSFAFQGTNAHVVLGGGPAGGGLVAATEDREWERQRLWLAPQPDAMIERVVEVTQASVTLSARLTPSRQAWLWDHVVAGRALVKAPRSR
jgi:acyl transferase domain-containing protein